MNASEAIEKICRTSLPGKDLRWCFVDKDKHPLKIDGTFARPNIVDDFAAFSELIDADRYAGVGISIQASKVCAIDVDHCFSIPNDINSADERAKSILSMFADKAYCEFSFSGTGLRVLTFHEPFSDYSKKYYIKNSGNNIEFYQPLNSFRYVTITGNVISDVWSDCDEQLRAFLDIYMIRPVKHHEVKMITECRSFEQLMKLVRIRYFKNGQFQELWFGKAPGSGKNESELDYHLLSELYENITQDKALLKQIFEASPYFKSKDFKHRCKWEAQDFRYYNYVYGRISE